MDVIEVEFEGVKFITQSDRDAFEEIQGCFEATGEIPNVTHRKLHREIMDRLPEFDGF